MHLIMMACMEILANCYSNGFLRIIIEDKGNLSEPALLEVVLTIRLEIFISHQLFFFSFFFLLLELFTKPLFIQIGLTKG